VFALWTVSVRERQKGYAKGVSECQENGGCPLTDLALWVRGAELVSSFVKRHGIGSGCLLQFKDLRGGVRGG